MLERSWPLFLLLAAACGTQVGGGEAMQPAESPVATAAEVAATPATMPESLETEGPATPGITSTVVLYSDLDAEVGSRMDGVISQVLVELGDRVAAGQTLAVLDDATQVARAAGARAAAELAVREHTRMTELHDRGFVTAAQYDEASYRRQSTEAALREAEVDLEHTRVIAPFAGVVTRRMTGIGRPVQEAEPLFRITALEPLRALARLPEATARLIRPGMPAILTADGGTEVAARVARVSPAVDPGSGTVEVLLDVPHPGPLRPGSSAAALISDRDSVR